MFFQNYNSIPCWVNEKVKNGCELSVKLNLLGLPHIVKHWLLKLDGLFARALLRIRRYIRWKCSVLKKNNKNKNNNNNKNLVRELCNGVTYGEDNSNILWFK